MCRWTSARCVISKTSAEGGAGPWSRTTAHLPPCTVASSMCTYKLTRVPCTEPPWPVIDIAQGDRLLRAITTVRLKTAGRPRATEPFSDYIRAAAPSDGISVQALVSRQGSCFWHWRRRCAGGLVARFLMPCAACDADFQNADGRRVSDHRPHARTEWARGCRWRGSPI